METIRQWFEKIRAYFFPPKIQETFAVFSDTQCVEVIIFDRYLAEEELSLLYKYFEEKYENSTIRISSQDKYSHPPYRNYLMQNHK